MIRLENVEVEMTRGADDWRKLVVTVRVKSARKPGLWGSVEVDPAAAGNAQATIAAVRTAGGAAAEYLGEKHGDNIDLEKAAALAVQAFREEVHLMSEASKGVGPLVARMMTYRARLPDAEREEVERWNWVHQHQQSFTPRDRTNMGKVLARLHRMNL